MKIVYVLCVSLALLSAGCGKKEIKPSEDSLRTKEAMELMNTIETAYREKDSEVLTRHVHPVIAKNIINNLSFDGVELNFSPWIVRIKESSTIISADWQGTWEYGKRKMQRRGIADFVFIDSPMKLVHINGDNPFFTPPADYEEEMSDVQGGPADAEEPPPAAADDGKPGPAVEPPEADLAAEQPAPGPVPSAADDETPDLEPLKRSKLLYREHDLVPAERQETDQGEDERKYIVQVGAWKNSRYADTALDLIKGFYPEAVIVMEGKFHKIRIKKMMSRQEGMLVIADIEEKFDLHPILIGLDPSDDAHAESQAVDNAHKYFVQIGVWRNREYAESALADLRKDYPEAVIIRSTHFHKVGIPVPMSRERADALAGEIKEKSGYDPIVIEE
jgi:cell division septation protein DedD